MKHLALFLRAPLQSWGVSGKFGERPTMSFPSKSGVLGLLAAATGIDRSNDKWLERAAKMRFSVRAYRTGPRLSDYHTVGGGYDSKSPRERRCIPAKAEDGKPGNTALTRREYLQDAVFGVVFSGDDDMLLEQIANGVQNPVWGIWLGRKSCIPTEPVFAGLTDSEDVAWKLLAKRWERLKKYAEELQRTEAQIASVIECEPGVADDLIPDVPLNFARRTYGVRAVEYEQASGEDTGADL